MPFDLPKLLPNSWQEFVDVTVLEQISRSLSGNFLPDQTKIFKSLELDPDEVKVIILGQDPYPNPDHATGLAFSVPRTVSALPASLRNIFQELESDVGVARKDGDLADWAGQGVLLLNSCLTIDPNNPLAHTKIGWQKFTDSIIEKMSQRQVIGILWGNQAQSMKHHFAQEDLITSAHPSPLSAYRGFFGSKPFSKCNKRLEQKGLAPIKW